MLANSYVFERLTSANLAELVALVHRSDPYAWPLPQLRSSLQQDWVIAVRASASQQLAGVLILGFTGFESELLYLLVAPEARRQGLAASLLNQALQRSQEELQAERMLLEVRASNQAALKLYSKYGFQQEGRRKNYYPPLPNKPQHPMDKVVEQQLVREIEDKYEDALLLSCWFI